MLHLEGGGAGVRAGGGLGDTNPHPPLVKCKKIDFILDLVGSNCAYFLRIPLKRSWKEMQHVDFKESHQVSPTIKIMADG